ncbi:MULTISPECIES: hypothetical protein [unclassified Mycolicibacterium]|uniref:hypothetical protein n=1 Tax=unclassified Mycolicibacterium TaxID=2636767 RepID=UPI002ED89C96
MAGRYGALVDTLRVIEANVLEEVWIGSVRYGVGMGLSAVLSAVSAWWCLGPGHASGGVPVVSAVMFGLAAVTSAMAVLRRRYRWCCAALYCCGLATVIGVGAFWWLRTGRHNAGLGWLVLADAAAIGLMLCWATVVVTPIERSQPDMRRGISSVR